MNRDYTWTTLGTAFTRTGVDTHAGEPVVVIVHGLLPESRVLLTMDEIDVIHGEMLAHARKLRADS